MNKVAEEKWVVVEIRKQEFAVPVTCVKEIVPLPDLAAVLPSRPQDRGVINLRGRFLPVFDTRKQFGWRSIPEEMQSFCDLMSRREQDHRTWLETLQESVAQGTEFLLTTDPAKCAFGLWYGSFRSESPWVTGLLRKFEEPHAKIHALAAGAVELVKKGRIDEALFLIDRERRGTLREMILLFEQLKEMMLDSVREIAVVMSSAQGPFVISVDRVVAVERVLPDMIREVPADPNSADWGMVHRTILRSSTSAPTMVLEPEMFVTHVE